MDDWLAQHRSREARCARTLKGKALLVIDHLLSESDDPMLGRIYRIAHTAAGVCNAPHKGWEKEIHDLYDKFQSV